MFNIWEVNQRLLEIGLNFLLLVSGGFMAAMVLFVTGGFALIGYSYFERKVKDFLRGRK